MNRFFHFTCRTEHIKWVEDLLIKEGYKFSCLPFFEKGRCLEYEPKPLGASLANFFRLIYIHDKASFLPPLCLEPSKGGVVLDLCASPGGKSSILSQMVGESGLVLANEPNNKRFNTLRYNIQKLNLFNVIFLNYRGEVFPDIYKKVKYVLLDVPCSGWGRDRIKNFLIWNEKNVDFLVELQRKLIKRAFEILSPGGRLVYSTCTTNKKENQEQIKWALSEFDFEIEEVKEVESFKYKVHNGFVLIDGEKSNSQSFFIGILRKKTSKFHLKTGKTKENQKGLTSDFSNEFKDFLILPDGVIRRVDSKIYFVHNKAIFFPELKYKGFQLGEIHSDGFVLFSNIRAFPNPESLNHKLIITDIQQLKRIVMGQKISVKTEQNWISIYWYELPIGFLKVQNNRAFWTKKIKIKRIG